MRHREERHIGWGRHRHRAAFIQQRKHGLEYAEHIGADSGIFDIPMRVEGFFLVFDGGSDGVFHQLCRGIPGQVFIQQGLQGGAYLRGNAEIHLGHPHPQFPRVHSPLQGA